MSFNDFKIRLGNLDIKVNINRNEVRRREQIKKNFDQDKCVREMLDKRYSSTDDTIM